MVGSALPSIANNSLARLEDEPAAASDGDQRYAALLRDSIALEKKLKRLEVHQVEKSCIKIPQTRCLQLLLEQSLQSGLFQTPAFVKRERRRIAELSTEDHQAQYDALCGVVVNLRLWLDECERGSTTSGSNRRTAGGGQDQKIEHSAYSTGVSSSSVTNEDSPPRAAEKRAQTQEDAPTSQPCGVKVNNAGISASYLRGREGLRDWINELYESGLELLNELGSVLFIFTTLRQDSESENKSADVDESSSRLSSDAFLSLETLYVLAVCTFVLSVFTRLLIGLSAYPEVDKGYTVKSDLSTGYLRVRKANEDGRPDQRFPRYFAAVLLYLVEPNSGRKAIAGTLRKTREFFNADGTSHEMHPLALENFLLHSECQTNIRTILAVMLLADLPELAVELLYLTLLSLYARTSNSSSSSSSSDNDTDSKEDLFGFVFWVSLFGTVVHLARLSLELKYELKHVAKLQQMVDNVDITWTREDVDGKKNDTTTSGAGEAALALRRTSTGAERIAAWARDYGKMCRVLTITSANVPKFPSAMAIAEHCYRLEKCSAADNPEIDDEVATLLTRRIFESNGGSSRLEKLFLNGTSVTDAGCAEFLQYCQSVHMLALSRTQFSDAGAKAVRKNCRELKVLGVNSCGLTDEGVRQLLYSEEDGDGSGTSNLHTFKLGDTPTTDVACRYIADALGAQLQTLHMFKCGISDEGIEAIAEKCLSLQEIDVHGLVSVTDRSAFALAKHCPGLKRFYLSGTGMGVDGFLAILEGRMGIMRLEAKDCLSLKQADSRRRMDEGVEKLKAAGGGQGLQLVL